MTLKKKNSEIINHGYRQHSLVIHFSVASNSSLPKAPDFGPSDKGTPAAQGVALVGHLPSPRRRGSPGNDTKHRTKGREPSNINIYIYVTGPQRPPSPLMVMASPPPPCGVVWWYGGCQSLMLYKGYMNKYKAYLSVCRSKKGSMKRLEAKRVQ